MKQVATSGARKNRRRPANLREQIDPAMCQAYTEARQEANGLLPTPTASLADHGGPNQRDSSGRPELQSAAAMWRTPCAGDAVGRSTYASYDSFKSGRIDKGGQVSLTNQVKFSQLWPTPKSSDAIMGMTARTSGRPIEKSTHLQTQVYLSEKQMFPTPTALDYAKESMESTQQSTGSKHSLDLPSAVKLFPTPHAQCYTGASDSQEGAPNLQSVVAMLPTPRASDCKGSGPIGSDSQKYMSGRDYLYAVVATEYSGQLNPDWVEWLMGLPTGWTDIDAAVEHPAPPVPGAFWPEEPHDIPRVASGIQNRVDRLKCLGNAVVPQQFYPIFKAIADIERGAK